MGFYNFINQPADIEVVKFTILRTYEDVFGPSLEDLNGPLEDNVAEDSSLQLPPAVDTLDSHMDSHMDLDLDLALPPCGCQNKCNMLLTTEQKLKEIRHHIHSSPKDEKDMISMILVKEAKRSPKLPEFPTKTDPIFHRAFWVG